jgi:SanA protein
MRRWLLRGFGLVSILVLALLAFDRYVAYRSAPKIHESIAGLPKRSYGLILGTNKYLAPGKENWYYRYRIEAAARLYRAGRVRKILSSGDGRSRYYDEVKRMRRDLIRAGVPASALLEDPGGVRTFDSLRRAQGKIDLDETIIVSQRFHLDRALFIASLLGGERTLGYAATAKEKTPAARRMQLRESAARGRMAWDLLRLKLMERIKGKETTE